LEAPQVRARREEPDRREVAARLLVRLVAWVLRPRVGEGESGWERVPEVQLGAPARLVLLVRRQGPRPDRGGESASGSTSDPSRHNAYPGLPTTPGQGNSHVSRETIPQKPHPACPPLINTVGPLLGERLSRRGCLRLHHDDRRSGSGQLRGRSLDSPDSLSYSGRPLSTTGRPKDREEWSCFLRQVEDRRERQLWQPVAAGWSFSATATTGYRASSLDLTGVSWPLSSTCPITGRSNALSSPTGGGVSLKRSTNHRRAALLTEGRIFAELCPSH